MATVLVAMCAAAGGKRQGVWDSSDSSGCTKPKASLIIPVQEPESFKSVVRSILLGPLPTVDLEFVLVTNDPTLERGLRDFVYVGERTSKSSRCLRICKSDKLGLAEGYNKGASCAKSNILVFMRDHLTPSPNSKWLDYLIQPYLNKNEKAGLLGGKIISERDNHTVSCAVDFGIEMRTGEVQVFHRYNGAMWPSYKRRISKDPFESVQALSSHLLAILRDDFDSIGQFSSGLADDLIGIDLAFKVDVGLNKKVFLSHNSILQSSLLNENEDLDSSVFGFGKLMDTWKDYIISRIEQRRVVQSESLVVVAPLTFSPDLSTELIDLAVDLQERIRMYLISTSPDTFEFLRKLPRFMREAVERVLIPISAFDGEKVGPYIALSYDTSFRHPIWKNAKFRIYRSSHESSDLPSSLSFSLQNWGDEVWVPTVFDYESFASSGGVSKDKLMIMSIPVDPFHFDPAAAPAMEISATPRAYSVLADLSFTRKNQEWKQALRAYFTEFGSWNSTVLYATCSECQQLMASGSKELNEALPGSGYMSLRERMQNKIDQFIEEENSFGRPRGDLPAYEVITEQISFSETPSFLRALNTLVIPGGSEGLTARQMRLALQAQAMLVPVAITNAGEGVREIIDEETGYLIEADSNQVPTLDHMKSTIRHLGQNYRWLVVRRITKKAREDVMTNNFPIALVETITNRLKSISDMCALQGASCQTTRGTMFPDHFYSPVFVSLAFLASVVMCGGLFMVGFWVRSRLRGHSSGLSPWREMMVLMQRRSSFKEDSKI